MPGETDRPPPTPTSRRHDAVFSRPLPCRLSRGSGKPSDTLFSPRSDERRLGCDVTRKGRTTLPGPTRAFGVPIHVHKLAQRLTRARQARAHCSDRDGEDLCHRLVGHAFEADEQYHLPLLSAEAGECALELPQLP